MSGTLDLPGGSIFCSALLLSVRCSAEARKDTIKVNHRRGTSQLWSSGLKRDQRMAPAKQRKGAKQTSHVSQKTIPCNLRSSLTMPLGTRRATSWAIHNPHKLMATSTALNA